MLKRTIGTLCVVGLALAMTACSSSSGSTGKNGDQTVTIGATLPMTGVGATYGNSMSKGLQAAVNVLNADKTVPGVTFNVKVTDDQAQPGLATSQAVQLATVNNAAAIVSAFTTPPIAQLKTAERYKVPVFNGGGNDPSLLNHDWLYNDILSSTQEEKAALQWAKEHLGVKRVGILVEGDFTTQGIAAIGQVGQDLFPGNSQAVTVDVNTTDPTPYITKVLSSHPDAIYLALPGTVLDQTLKQLGSQGVKVPLITPSGAFALNDLTQLSVKSQLLMSRQSYEPIASYTAAIKKYYPNFKPDVYTGTYYTLGFIIAKAVAEAKSKGKITGATVKTALDSMDPAQGCCGPVGFTTQHGTTSAVQLVQLDAGGADKVVWTGPAPSI